MTEAGATTGASAEERTHRRGRIRSISYYVVLVVAGILLLLSTFAIWINRVALNTSVFVNTNTSLIEDDRIRQAIATRAVDDLYSSVDVQAELQQQLPKNLKSLSGPASAALRQAAYTVVDRALQQPAVQALFAASLREAHQTLVQVLKGGGPNVSTENGVVTLNLRQIILDAADRIGIGKQIADKVPADAGRIVILRSDQLSVAQNGFQLLKTLAWVLPILTLLAFGGALWLAGADRRRKAVRGIGVTILVVGALGLIAAHLTGNYVVNSLVQDRDTRKAAGDAWNILTVLMRASFKWFLVIGILFVIAAWLAGPGRRAMESRSWLAPALRDRVWPYVGLAVVAVILLLTGNVSDTTRYLFDLLFLALIAVWIEVTRSQTLREFPDAGAPALIGQARSSVSGWFEARRQRSAQTTAAAAAAAPAADVSSRLAQLAALHSSGELTDEEYAAAKAQILSGS
ncbi:MAG TPA: SHOCT domain-containing protein [Gaiellaceae bacterium]|nr:SHOCT domain-containing protein [Gaiellaceae bacterium]